MIEIKERPILFSSEMVRAILDGRKTETRRVMRPQPSSAVDWEGWSVSAYTPKGSVSGRGRFPTNHLDPAESSYGEQFFKSPHGMSGDILYVRETFSYDDKWGWRRGWENVIEYRADCDEIKCRAYKWKPSIFMPKKFSRIKLKIKEIRVERIQEITEIGAIDEGAFTVKSDLVFPGYSDRVAIALVNNEKPPLGPTARQRFKYLWNSLNYKRGFGWDKDPWCWVIKFERIK